MARCRWHPASALIIAVAPALCAATGATHDISGQCHSLGAWQRVVSSSSCQASGWWDAVAAHAMPGISARGKFVFVNVGANNRLVYYSPLKVIALRRGLARFRPVNRCTPAQRSFQPLPRHKQVDNRVFEQYALTSRPWASSSPSVSSRASRTSVPGSSSRWRSNGGIR